MSTQQLAETSAPAQTNKALTAPTSKSKRSNSKNDNGRTPEELQAALAEYGRGDQIAVKNIKDKKLRGKLKKLEYRYKAAATNAKDAEMLMEEQQGYVEAEGMERTYKFSQKDLVQAVDVSTAQKGFDLKLPLFGPYAMDYTRNGRYLLLGGLKGHVAAFDWREGKIGTELQLKETVRDVKWLHNEQFFAVAQKKYTYIYDHAGVEIHCLKSHVEVTNMEFLPYHFILATVGMSGWLKYQDTTTGALIAEFRTRLGAPSSMAMNQRNAIINIGHANGSVTLWSPNMNTPLVKMLTNRGPVRALAIDRGGHYMVTAGADARMNIFDIRTYKEVHSYFTPTPASSLHISETGLLGVGWGPHVTVWKDALKVKQNSPYLTHLQEGSAINRVRFCPFDDVLGVGHADGFSSLIVPGSGEPNFDALEINPYETKKQRQEGEIKALLNKLKPEMISLEPDFIGRIDNASHDVRKKEYEENVKGASAADKKMGVEGKRKQRGKNSALRRYLRKKGEKNIIDEKRLKFEEMRKERAKRQQGLPSTSKAEELGPALSRFLQPGAK